VSATEYRASDPGRRRHEKGQVGPALGYLFAGGGVRRLEGGERPQPPKRAAAQGRAGLAGDGGGGEARHGGAGRRVLDSKEWEGGAVRPVGVP